MLNLAFRWISVETIYSGEYCQTFIRTELINKYFPLCVHLLFHNCLDVTLMEGRGTDRSWKIFVRGEPHSAPKVILNDYNAYGEQYLSRISRSKLELGLLWKVVQWESRISINERLLRYSSCIWTEQCKFAVASVYSESFGVSGVRTR